MTTVRALGLAADGHVPHRLHAQDRPWPETNCYLDLWIELLGGLGRDPVPLLGCCAGLAWEGDHVTFLKPSAGDLLTTAGVVLQELALWDDTAGQVATQLARGAVPLLEVDAWFLPDTEGTAYRHQHTKTTIGIVALDLEAGWLEYLHNAGLFRLTDEDLDGVLGRPPHAPGLFPYAELARLSAAPFAAPTREAGRDILARIVASRPPGNPIEAMAADLPGLMARVGSNPLRTHALCFNTARQLGGGFGLLADHIAWLGGDSSAAVDISERAKALQFQMARAARRGRDDPALAALLRDLAGLWERVEEEMAALIRR